MITRIGLKYTRRSLVGIVLALFFSWSGMAYTPKPQEGTEFSAIARSQPEVDAFNAVVAETDPTNRLLLAEGFLSDYPDSELTHKALSVRLQSYVDLENHQSVIEAAEAALAAELAFYDSKRAQLPEPEQLPGFAAFRHESMIARRVAYQSLMNAYLALGEFTRTIQNGELALEVLETDWEEFSPTLTQSDTEFQEALQNLRQNELFYLQVLVNAYERLDNWAKTVEYGQRALTLDPQNLPILITVSSVMAERPPADENAWEDHFDRAQKFALDALDAVEEFLAEAGAQIDAAQQANLRSMVHSTLGLVYLSQEKLSEAQAEYRSALEAVPDDPVAHYRLGEAHAQAGNVDEALQSLARSVYLGGVTEQLALDLLRQIYELTDRSEDDLEEFIRSEGENIGGLR